MNSETRRVLTRPHLGNVVTCAFFLISHFVAQLLLVPHGSPFDQIMLLVSFAVSLVYNSYLSSDDRVKLQRKIPREIILPQMPFTRYKLRTQDDHSGICAARASAQQSCKVAELPSPIWCAIKPVPCDNHQAPSAPQSVILLPTHVRFRIRVLPVC